MQSELTEDVADAAFINQRVALHDRRRLSGNDVRLVGKEDLGIRDDGRREECMCMSALAAGRPADMEDTGESALPDGTVIVTVYR